MWMEVVSNDLDYNDIEMNLDYDRKKMAQKHLYNCPQLVWDCSLVVVAISMGNIVTAESHIT